MMSSCKEERHHGTNAGPVGKEETKKTSVMAIANMLQWCKENDEDNKRMCDHWRSGDPSRKANPIYIVLPLCDVMLPSTPPLQIQLHYSAITVTAQKEDTLLCSFGNESDDAKAVSPDVAGADRKRASELHPFRHEGLLLGGGRRKKRERAYQKESRVMDSILCGRKQSKCVDILKLADLSRVDPWQDLVRSLVDELFVILDEEVAGDTRSTVTVILEVYSKIDQVLMCAKPNAQPLRDVLLPYVRTLFEQNKCAARHIFRSKGSCIENYMLAEILATDKCKDRKAHSRNCSCIFRIRGINSMYGYAAEFLMNDEASRVNFLTDLNDRFEFKHGKLSPKGVLQGFNFSEKNCFDLFCNETRIHDRGASLLTSINYVESCEKDVVIEKIVAKVAINLSPGDYDFAVVPTATKPSNEIIEYFDLLGDMPGAMGDTLSVTESIHTISFIQRKSKSGSATHFGDKMRYWLFVWRRKKHLAFSETLYISVLRTLKPRSDMVGRVKMLKSSMDLEYLSESVPSCANY